MLTTKKRLGYGSLSLVLLLLGFLMNWPFRNDFIVSHSLFEKIGLEIYSNGSDGFHYPFLAPFPLWLAAFLISRKYLNDYGAAISNKIGKLMLVISVAVTIVFLILPTWIKL